ncbi:hypothetical protein A3C24_03470 [Candidatus Roizmanbacteria bacterium RIFCSPHIGHO2_02_FULL_37_24]|uniref:Uncharacterized protein n=1 Tax=Candidatus Roizmanbacteria bacterium RIFCSPHIGHO2_02_FULL_37_24 TaxID=1802037 RepID=A0A1F7GVB9_9BACT|nr:MAG: hypothetical protein A3C24_03470 [Candidatus Roizmanbacteria bacterium RIFCSPHIGHO2_02_FULL_37_24]OGK32453.1 MAG: hypothetical protein A3E10_03975 [Candidatus Roizmanbacteria bacterium RIFCSPHIGHO2_12_FULL_37_23]OGK44997.1 MAG: hypothetical protein A2956_00465 [Candidatus Roizmanbacteria bacterium RIFCSPLOWO2_01_FULL_37_57]OGK58944.1 MAG: hypothetical protein A3G65_04345 [Candidatus Roizmanbacteria bacterium RIFCSPLOWO2_12_FULL_37_7b]
MNSSERLTRAIHPGHTSFFEWVDQLKSDDSTQIVYWLEGETRTVLTLHDVPEGAIIMAMYQEGQHVASNTELKSRTHLGYGSLRITHTVREYFATHYTSRDELTPLERQAFPGGP